MAPRIPVRLVHDDEAIEAPPAARGLPLDIPREALDAARPDRHMNVPHERQRCSINSPRAAPSKNGALPSSGTGTGRCDCSVASGGMLAQDRRRVEVQDAAVSAREHDVVLRDLPLARLATRLSTASEAA